MSCEAARGIRFSIAPTMAKSRAPTLQRRKVHELDARVHELRHRVPHEPRLMRGLCSAERRRTLRSQLRGRAVVAVDVRGVCTLILVFDMPTSLKFYRDVLGFKVVATNDDGAGDDVDWCYLRLDKTELMLNTMYETSDRPDAPDRTRVAVHADTCLYFGCPDVDAAYRYLRSRGVEVTGPTIAPYGMKQLYVLDPDGYNLCFQWEATPHEQPVP
jgi:glyoxylase I family protein